MKISFAVLFLAFTIFSSKTLAEISLSAKIVSFDKVLNVISAYGDVVATQEFDGKIRELRCERIEYNGKTKELEIIGDSVIKEPTGEIIRAKNAKIDIKLKNAIIKALNVILSDNSKIKAETGTKIGNIYSFENANYTPCDESGCLLPLWDLAAEKVVYDVEKKALIYKNVKLRIKGRAIAFLPYFKHPAFGIKRQTGFLAPIINSSKNLGFFMGIPYFIVLDKDKDLKLTPFINAKNRAFMAGRYRQSLPNGDLKIAGSFLTKAKIREKTPLEERKTRWHCDIFFQSYKVENKRITFKIERESDVDYKTKYPVSGNRFGGMIKRKGTESKFAVDFFDRNYFITTDSYIFQTPDKNIAPIVIPHFNLNHRTEDVLSGVSEIDSDILCLSRDSSKNESKEKPENFPGISRRMFRTSNSVKWSNSVPINHILLDIKTAARLDSYNFARDNEPSKNKVYPVLENQISGFLPLVSDFSKNSYKSIWGPKVSLSSVESFNKRKKLEINEDSVFSESDDLNLHRLNRFGTYDRIENGERISAGIENSTYNSKRRFLNFFIGKARDIGGKNNKTTKNYTVGRFIVKPTEFLSFRSRFVGIPFVDNLKLFESGINIKKGRVSSGIGYIYDSRKNPSRQESLSQLGFSLGFKISQFWNVNASQILNMKEWMGNSNLSRGIFFDYKDECFGFGFGIYQSRFKNKNVSNKTGFMITICFKNLANIGGDLKKRIYKANAGIVE